MSSSFGRDDSYAFFRISVNFTLKLIEIMRERAREWNILFLETVNFSRRSSKERSLSTYAFVTIRNETSYFLYHYGTRESCRRSPMAGKNQCRASPCTISATLTACKRRLFLGAYINGNARRQEKQPKTAGALGHVGKFVANTDKLRQWCMTCRERHFKSYALFPYATRSSFLRYFLSLLCFRAASAGSAISPSTSSYQRPKFVR